MPDELERRYHVGFARAYLQGMQFTSSLYDELRSTWPAGARATRYNRTWHLTKILHEDKDFAFARIGFVAEGELSTLQFDEERQEFVYGAAPSGTVVPFTIRKSDLAIAFQLRAGVVRETTFTGALQDLLRGGSQTSTWLIETFARIADLESWLKDVDRNVQQFDATLERPNPHYFHNQAIEDLVENGHLSAVRFSARARDGESINLEYPLFQQALDHVIHEYGRAKLVGTLPDGDESVWVKQSGQPPKVPASVTRTAAGGEEVPDTTLIEAMQSLPAGAEASILDADD